MMKNMYLVNILIIMIFTTGCGVESFTSASTSLIERRSFLNLTSLEEVEIDNNIRSTTLLIYPKAEDLERFEFVAPTAQAWSGVKEILSYGESVQTVIPLSMPAFEKSAQVIFTIISAGQARDDAFIAIKKAEEKLEKLLKERDELLAGTEKKLEAIEDFVKDSECYYKDRPGKDENFICRLEKDDDFRRRKRIRDCDDVIEIEFPDFSEAENELLNSLKSDCNLLLEEEEKVKNGPIRDEIDRQQEIISLNSQYRDDGKQVVIDLLEGGVEKINPNVFLTTGAENEKPNDVGPYSIIKFSDDKKDIETFSLRLDLGTNYSDGAGFQEYSLENGKITDLRYYKRSNLETVLEFKIITKDFTIEAELFESIQEYHGLRYVGDLVIKYPNGTTREGVGKIEVSLKK